MHADALAESVMAAVLSRAKRLPERLENQRAKVWKELHCLELNGANLSRTLGLVFHHERSLSRSAQAFVTLLRG